MIFGFLKHLGRQSKDESQKNRVLIYKNEHSIDPSKISIAANKAIKGLREKGYLAFIVGGAVRDLLLGLTPKDFDIATNATPEETKKIFRRSKIIGRRFRLVHVYFGREVLEISTFRATVSTNLNSMFLRDTTGRIIRDNIFGTQEEDALRRDFTVNAMFYSPDDEVVIDYSNGYRDLVAKKLKIIGKPDTRFREDPIRILRAVRFSSQLGLSIDKSSLKSMRLQKHLLLNVPSSRLFEETLKVLLCGEAVKALSLPQSYEFLGLLLPEIKGAMSKTGHKEFLFNALNKTDERVANNQPNSPAFVLAAIFWHEVLSRWQKEELTGKKPFSAIVSAIDGFINKRSRRSSLEVPKRLELDMRNIWLMQAKFQKIEGRQPYALLRTSRFRAGYDFMLLRADVGQLDNKIANWWQIFLRNKSDEKKTMSRDQSGSFPGKGYKKRFNIHRSKEG